MASGRLLRRLAALAAAVAFALPLAACAPAASSEIIALLLPDAKTARYETFDRPVFEARVAELGDYRVTYANADGDAAKQQQQAESALASGARVLVLDPV
ncbi:MAG TPA: ABC transporter substrate-binding protein, partial [Microbacterium sp.]|nr:ABC transporter substrate-binding protein [Microbacterium sp.]